MAEQALENNKVMLWGELPIKKSLLEKYDKGNKNPHSLLRINKKDVKKKEEKKEEVKRVFTKGENYSINDIDFLNSEYERLVKEIEKARKDGDNILADELYDTHDDLLEIIEGLEHFKKLSGGRIAQGYELRDDVIRYDKSIGKGFKKGSPEAIEHAEKMRKGIEKRTKNIKSTKKGRIEKGSEEAKEIGRKMAEAKKLKREQNIIKEEEEEIKQPLKGKPWYYIGDIPKGYREATEDEAIEHKKVSQYGKYIVDIEKWRLFRDYNLLLSDKKTNNEIVLILNSLKKRIIEALKKVEIYYIKVENDKYKDRLNEFTIKLEEEKDKRKHLQAGYDWYNKLLSERLNKQYKRDKIVLEKPTIDISQIKKKEIEYVKPDRPIDPRTGKEVEEGGLYIDRINRTDNKEEKKKEENNEVYGQYLFVKDKDFITISTKYFTRDLKLKPKYVKKAFDKGIILKRKHYTKEDYDKYFYGMKGEGYGIVNK